jgi:hypothetical protein
LLVRTQENYAPLVTAAVAGVVAVTVVVVQAGSSKPAGGPTAAAVDDERPDPGRRLVGAEAEGEVEPVPVGGERGAEGDESREEALDA